MNMEINNLERQLPAELVALLKTDPSAAEAVKKYVDQVRRHHANPLYTEARELFKSTQVVQIDKGVGKYPEPLNSQIWTLDELVEHTMMEMVDGIHYITGMKSKARDIRSSAQQAIAALVADKADIDSALDCLKDILKQL